MHGGHDILIFVPSPCFLLSVLEMRHRQPLFAGDVHEPHGHGDDHGHARSQGNTSHGASRIRRSAEQHKAKTRAAPLLASPSWYAEPGPVNQTQASHPNRFHGRTDQVGPLRAHEVPSRETRRRGPTVPRPARLNRVIND